MKKFFILILLVTLFNALCFIRFIKLVFAASSNTGISLIITNVTSTETPTSTPTPIPSATPTTASSSTSSSSDNNNNNNSASAPACCDPITKGTPDLFEIRTNKNAATLYFAPPPAPYSSFYIAYSSRPDFWEYGVNFNQNYTGGVISYTIKMLKPNTKYFFKIRAGNGNASGNWGNAMAVSTTKSTTFKTYYKNIFTAFVQQTKTAVNSIVSNIKTSAKKGTTLGQQTVPNAVPKVQSQPATQPQKPAAVKNKFCILWWCF
jgi:hypothetical protein